MSDENAVEITNTFDVRGREYAIIGRFENDQLTIEIEDSITTEQWKGEFSASFIEDLTHKTGNFKQFSIFTTMLESALKEESDSVSIDILTFSDLETLRGQKCSKPSKRHTPQRHSNSLKTKRYLILTYAVEFDRIHYPLPLIYSGKPDVQTLQTNVLQLRQEVKFLKSRLRKLCEGTDVESLELAYEKLLTERDHLASDLSSYKQEFKTINSANISKELKVLKQVVQSLESDLLKERTKYQRMINKKKQEIQRLAEELEDVKSSERNLKARCKSLTEELNMLKNGVSPSVRSGRYSGNRPMTKSRVSRGKPVSRTPSPIGQRFDPTSYIKEKQRKLKEAELSRSRKRYPQNISIQQRSRSVSLERRNISGGIGNKGQTSRYPPRSTSRDTTRHRHQRTSSIGSVSSIGSIPSSRDSDSDVGSYKNTSRSKGNSRRIAPNSNNTRRTKKVRLPSASDCSDNENRSHSISRGLNHSRSNGQKRKTLSQVNNRSPLHSNHANKSINGDSFDRAFGISEIDARLDALQRFMKENMK